MLTLYYKPTCAYCQNVLAEAENLGVNFRLKDISLDQHLVDELIEKGGKKQVPFLIDDVKGEQLYESADIVSYLNEFYASASAYKSFGGLRIHASDDTCDTCQ
jgi:glutathione S-transferase